MFNDYTFNIKCNENPYMLIKVVAENYDKAVIYAKSVYAASHPVYADDRENHWEIK